MSLVLVSWLVFRPFFPRFTPPVLPVPNGYKQLVKASEGIAARTNLYRDLDEAEITSIAEQNRPALKLVQQALQLKCGVPIDWSRGLSTGLVDKKYLNHVSSMRDIARALSADMRYCITNKKVDEAVLSGLTTFKLGCECYRGGLMVDHLVGVAIQGIAISELRTVALLAPETKREILVGLLPLLDTGETCDEIIQRELDFIQSAVRNFADLITRQFAGPTIEPAVQASRQAAGRTTAQQRLFLTHLAINIYHDQHDNWPATLAELTPDILPAILIDPYSNGNFIYIVENDEYKLYSVGRNKRDDGGVGDDSGLQADFVDDFTLETPPTEQPER